MVKEFVLIERGEYDRLKDSSVLTENEVVSDNAPGSSMLSTQHLLSAVKNKVGIMYHNKVAKSNSCLNFSDPIPQYSRGLILVKLLSMVFICLELMFMKC